LEQKFFYICRQRLTIDANKRRDLLGYPFIKHYLCRYFSKETQTAK
jgi:hypothetical protein